MRAQTVETSVERARIGLVRAARAIGNGKFKTRAVIALTDGAVIAVRFAGTVLGLVRTTPEVAKIRGA